MPASAVTLELAPAYARRDTAARPYRIVLLGVLLVGLLYELVLLLTPLLDAYRFPVPFAVPIFDTPFALVAMGVAYLCFERHRLRQDLCSAALGVSLGLAGLLALAHILTQPDYPGTPGVNAGVAPYFFFLSYLAALAGIAVAAQSRDTALPLSDRARFWIGAGMVVATVIVVVGVLEIRPLLPSLVMKPGRLTPFAVLAASVTDGLVALWALWGGWRWLTQKREPFAGFLLLAALIWLLGIVGLLILPFRYGVSWYLAGLARPIGVGVVFVALLREQVWLYRDARAHQQNLEALHTAGQALVRSLDPEQIVDTIAAKALEVSKADGVILFRLDAAARTLRAVRHAGKISEALVAGLELPIGVGVAGRAVAERRPVWRSSVQGAGSDGLPAAVVDRVQREGFSARLAIPLQIKGDEIFGALAVLSQGEREFREADVDLLAAFGAQASVALDNARLYGEAQRYIEQLLEQSRELLRAKVAAEQASRAKSEFLASVSHELRTPLNSVIGFSQVLQNKTAGELNERQLEYLTTILAGGQRLLNLVDDVLDLAKVEAGRLTLDLAHVAVADLLAEVVGVIQPLARQKNITVSTDVTDPLPTITADPQRVKQVIFNLLSNAIKFTGVDGSVKVTVDTAREALAAGEGAMSVLRLAVADTGIGIKAQDQARIFDPFEQVDASSAREQGGTGLGLALTRRLVELHGGKISVESEGVKGRGSVFKVVLPIAAPEPRRG